MRKALIIGAGGQDGRILSELFSSNCVNVSAISSRNSLEHCDNIFYVDYSWSIPQKRRFLKHILHDNQFDYIVDFSSYNKSYSETGWHLSSEVIDSVLYMPLFVLKYLSCCGYQPNIFYCGSAHQYQPSEASVTTIDELSLPSPRNEYGLYKEQLRSACHYYRQNLGINVSFGILFNHDSCYRSSNFLLPRLVDSVINSYQTGNIHYFDAFLSNFDSDFCFDLSDAQDICFDIYTILLKGCNDDFVLSSGKLISFQDICAICILNVFQFVGGSLSDLSKLNRLLENHFLDQTSKNTVSGLKGDNSKISSLYHRSPSCSKDIIQSIIKYKLQHS